MKKIILLGFLYLPICIFAQKNYFSITGRTFLEEYIVPNQTTKSPLSAGAYIQIKGMPERGWLADTEGYFKIDSLRKGKYHLTFSCIGLERVWGIERSGFFNGREKWAKGFENQRV